MYSPNELYNTKIQYNVYVNHYIYLMMALCGRNMSLNLHDSLD
jgi:hypothetical protein